MEDHGLLTEKPALRPRCRCGCRRARLGLAGTVSQTGQQKIADLRVRDAARTPASIGSTTSPSRKTSSGSSPRPVDAGHGPMLVG